MISLQYYNFPILCIIYFAILCKQFDLGLFSCVLLGLKSVRYILPCTSKITKQTQRKSFPFSTLDKPYLCRDLSNISCITIAQPHNMITKLPYSG